MIQLDNVTQHYGVRPILIDLSLNILENELAVVLGPNGMGKTTMLRVMAGVLAPQRGTVTIAGHQRRNSVEDEIAIRSQTVYLPDDVWLPGTMTGREYLLHVASLYGVDALWAMEHADQLLQLFQLVREGDWPMRSYSSGQKKKISLCSSVISQAPIMLLDEPFSGGLDPAGIFAFKRILQRLIQKQVATVVLTTPVGELVEELAGRVIVVRHGRIAADGSVAELRRQSKAGGPLEEVLEQLVHPQLMESILAYFDVVENR